jgi:hypothetical protein
MAKYPHFVQSCITEKITDAHAACALYIARNETNSYFVSRHIEKRVKELLDLPLPTTLVESLAQTQSLCLYLSIQVFGNDFRSHAQAEQMLPHFDSLASNLHECLCRESREDPSALTIYPIAETRTFWRSWILHESAQRSMLVAFCLLSIAYLLCGRKNYCQEHVQLKSCLMLSSHLWHAQSAFDFALAWNEKEHLEMRQLEVSRVLETALPEDLDVFGRMQLVASIGMDDLRGWCRTKGREFDATYF